MKNATTTKKSPIIITLEVNSNAASSGWKTIIFNCYCHSFDEVVTQIMRVTRFNREKSIEITATAETTGSATVCEGGKDYCEKIARMLGGVGLTVTVNQ